MNLRDNLTSERQKERYDKNCNSVETTFTQKELEKHDKEIRNKAIDEFCEKLLKRLTEKSQTTVLSTRCEVKNIDFLTLDTVSDEIEKIVEQLKGED